MSFPVMNAHHHGHIASGAAVFGDTNNWFRVQAVVEPSAMELQYALATTKAAASASVFTARATDGGSGGTGTADIHGAVTNSPSSGTAWTDITPRVATGTSATDLDADDYVNLVTTTAGTAATGLVAMATYVYGKPGRAN